ncbi:hypothetical protein ACFFRR_005564 [Megaselia abdita]
MDPNVSKYHNNSGNQYHYNIPRQLPPKNHASFYKHYISDSNIINSYEGGTISEIVNMNSSNLHETVIKNYKKIEDRRSYNSYKNYNTAVSNTYNMPTNQNYGEIRTNTTLLSSVIQSTNNFSGNYQNTELQKDDNVQYMSTNPHEWRKNSNYFCKKLPDFSNLNMEVAPESYQHYSGVTTNQHIAKFTNKYSDHKTEGAVNPTRINPYSSCSSNKSVISHYQSIPQTVYNTQRNSGNYNTSSAKKMYIQNDNYSIKPELSFISCNSQPVSTYANVSRLQIPRSNISIQKPNYTEMINKVYNMKKSMTERELNMKIIERTLLSKNTRQIISNHNQFNLKVPDSVCSSNLVSVHVPLDLSIKSVKTSPDSTNFSLGHRTLTSSGTLQVNNQIIYSSPKLDFLPLVSKTAERLLNQQIPNSAINLTTTTKLNIKSINDSPSSRIRTKGELKIFNPNSIKCSQQLEVATKQSEDFCGLEKEIQNINLFDWDTTCNKLLKQLRASSFPQHNLLEKHKNTVKRSISHNKNILRRNHKRVLFDQKRLQNRESNSEDDETFDTLTLKKNESFRYWRRKRRIYLKSKNNNNNNNINQNIQPTSIRKKMDQSLLTTDDEYKHSDNESINNSSDILSSISEKLTIQKEKESPKKVSKISGMITRSKSLLTKKKINLRKRLNIIPLSETKVKKPYNRNLHHTKMVSNNHCGNFGKAKKKTLIKQIDWEIELKKDKNITNHFLFKKIKGLSRQQSSDPIEDNLGNKICILNPFPISLNEKKVQEIEHFRKNDILIKSPTANIRNIDSGHSSFEKKYEEYISHVYNDSVENENHKSTLLKKKSFTRRKPSSGFDYIRKKKRTRPQISSPTSFIQSVKKSKTISKFEKKVKTEKDIHSEIHKWVLNKSVGQTTLHKAARLGYIDVVCYCLERLHLNPNVKDNAGYTPLHEACSKGFIDIARCLLRYGANLSETAHSGIRAIHEASESGSVDIFRLLLKYGADPQITTYNGKSPYVLAENISLRRYMETFLKDMQFSANKQSCRFYGPWTNIESEEEIQLEDTLDNKKEIVFEFEECDNPLPPVYQLKHISDNSEWMLLNDLSNMLNIRSKDKLLKHVH